MQGPKLPGVLEGILGVASSKKAAVATSQASKRNSLRTSLAELCITTCSNGRRPSDGEAAEIKSLVRVRASPFLTTPSGRDHHHHIATFNVTS